MARWIVAGLFVLNVLLGVGVYLRLGGERSARADLGKPPSPIALVAGTALGNCVLYVLDTDTGKLAALQIDVVNKQTKILDQRNIAADMQRTPR